MRELSQHHNIGLAEPRHRYWNSGLARGLEDVELVLSEHLDAGAQVHDRVRPLETGAQEEGALAGEREALSPGTKLGARAPEFRFCQW